MVSEKRWDSSRSSPYLIRCVLGSGAPQGGGLVVSVPQKKKEEPEAPASEEGKGLLFSGLDLKAPEEKEMLSLPEPSNISLLSQGNENLEDVELELPVRAPKGDIMDMNAVIA